MKKAIQIFLSVIIMFTAMGIPVNAYVADAETNDSRVFIQTDEYSMLLDEYEELCRSSKTNENRKSLEELCYLIKEYPQYILEKQKMSEQQLKTENYTEEQIYAIKNYDGSPAMTKAASASVTGSLSHVSRTYNSSANRTYVTVTASVHWNGTPLVKGTDTLGIALAGSSTFVRSNSYCLISHPTGSVYSSSYQTQVGLGVQYRFGISADGINMFNYALLSYTGVAEGNVNVYAFSGAYSHFTYGSNIGFGFSIGGSYSAGISFTPVPGYELMWSDDDSVY